MTKIEEMLEALEKLRYHVELSHSYARIMAQKRLAKNKEDENKIRQSLIACYCDLEDRIADEFDALREDLENEKNGGERK